MRKIINSDGVIGSALYFECVPCLQHTIVAENNDKKRSISSHEVHLHETHMRQLASTSSREGINFGSSTVGILFTRQMSQVQPLLDSTSTIQQNTLSIEAHLFH